MDVPSVPAAEVEMTKAQREIALASEAPDEGMLDADVLLVRQLQCGDAEAGHRFVRDYYPGIYRYLHYLQGYTCEEIAPIIRASVSTVKYRLATARAHLQRELGEGDLAYLNEPGVLMRRWAWLPLDQMSALEARLAFVDHKGEPKMS